MRYVWRLDMKKEKKKPAKVRQCALCSNLQHHPIPFFGDNFHFCVYVRVRVGGFYCSFMRINFNVKCRLKKNMWLMPPSCDFDDVCMCNEPSIDAVANNFLFVISMFILLTWPGHSFLSQVQWPLCIHIDHSPFHKYSLMSWFQIEINESYN